jgi:hypothetical protein
MRTFTVAITSLLLVGGCASTHVTVVDASAEGGSILLRGPEPNLAAHDYLAKACPNGSRIVSEDEEAAERAIELDNLGIAASVTTSLTYTCERGRKLVASSTSSP